MSGSAHDSMTVPFISDWADPRPFSDIGDAEGVLNPAHMLEGWAEARTMSTRGITLEAAVGEWNTVPAALLELLSRHRRAVARIVVPPGQVDHRGIRSENGWTGTGFLVAPNLLLTNHHVLNSPEVAASAIVEFDYEWPAEKLLANIESTDAPVARFHLTPNRLFTTSPATGKSLDYSFIWISEDAAQRFGSITMERGSFMINTYEPTFIIHHPRGRMKEISVDDTELLGINTTSLLYAADTDYGSSGACVFNRNGRLVALHHARRSGSNLAQLYPEGRLNLRDGRPVNVANEGIKISAIALDLEERIRRGGRDAEYAREVLAAISGADTLTGLFGGLGRRTTAEAHSDRVLQLYCSNGQDVDIGFWNLNWLLDAMHDKRRIDAVVNAMIDVNMDVWCLTDVPPAIVTQLVEHLGRKFGEQFSHLYGSPDADRLQLTTAIIWRKTSIACRAQAWPAEMARLWTQPVPDPSGNATSGQAFRAAPPLFEVRSHLSASRRVARLVPVSLRDLGGDEYRRRIASKLIAMAIDKTLTRGDAGPADDWIIGGDQRPPLAPDDSADFKASGYATVGLRSKTHGGTLTYLRGAQTLIETIFITECMGNDAPNARFLEVAPNRCVDKHFGQLTEDWPDLLRLAIAGHGTSATNRTVADALVQMLQSAPATTSTGWPGDLLATGLGKSEFLRQNAASLQALARHISGGEDGTAPLTETDLRVIIYCEAGLRNGLIDPDARHSNGERGLLPLPDNIADWIGAGKAPPWDQPMDLAVNLETYARYLFQIKNKSVVTLAGRTLYRDLFREPGIAGNPQRQAKLLAGIVHGYFVAQNYGSAPVPFERILAGYRSDLPLPKMLAGSGYVHAGSSILANRQANIDAALAL